MIEAKIKKSQLYSPCVCCDVVFVNGFIFTSKT